MSNASDFIIENGVLIKYVGKGGTVTVPDEVVKIGDNAFEKCSKLTEIILPDGLLEIGEHAFRLCKNLIRIEIPGSCKSTGFFAFEKCTGLRSVVLCEGVENVNAYSFMDCKALTEISLPDSLKTISMGGFNNCQSLKNVIIPTNLSSIREGAFGNCISIEHLSVPKLVMDAIDAKWFNSCFHNVDIYLLWLRGCTNFDERVGKLCAKAIQRKKEEYAAFFINNSNAQLLTCFLDVLKKVTLDDVDHYIAMAAEKGNAEINSLLLAYKDKTFSSQMIEQKHTECAEKDLGTRDYTVSDWRKQFKFTIADGQVHISEYRGSEAFVVVPGKIGKNRVVSVAISNCPWGRVINTENVKIITEVVIENGVQEIVKGAFSGCKCLRAVSVPESMNKIEDRAFFGCESLLELRIPYNVTEIGRNVFEKCANLTIIAPSGSYAETYAKENNIPFVAE